MIYKIRKINLFICIILFLNSCSSFVIKDIKYESVDNEWEVSHYIPSWSGWQIGFFIRNEEKLPHLTIVADKFRSTYREMHIFWLLPIPLIDSYSTNYENCTPNFYLNFQVTYLANENSKNNLSTKTIVEKYFRKNKIVFDTSKIFIIKNNKRYKIDLTKLTNGTILDPNYILYNERKSNWNEDYILDVSSYILAQINKKEVSSLKISNQFTSPFGCNALEGATLEIGGISINGKELKPIKINMSYKNK